MGVPLFPGCVMGTIVGIGGAGFHSPCASLTVGDGAPTSPKAFPFGDAPGRSLLPFGQFTSRCPRRGRMRAVPCPLLIGTNANPYCITAAFAAASSVFRSVPDRKPPSPEGKANTPTVGDGASTSHFPRIPPMPIQGCHGHPLPPGASWVAFGASGVRNGASGRRPLQAPFFVGALWGRCRWNFPVFHLSQCHYIQNLQKSKVSP